MPRIEDYDDQLIAAIRTAVRETKLEDDRAADIKPLSDMSIDFIEEREDGSKVYDVYGDTMATMQSSIRDSGNYYDPPEWDEAEVGCSVNLKVTTYPDSDDIEVEVEDILFEDEDPFDEEWGGYDPDEEYERERDLRLTESYDFGEDD